MLLCPPLCCRLEQAARCKLEEGRVGANVMLAGKGSPHGPWGPWHHIGARGGRGDEAHAPLSRCCSLFVPLTLAAVALVLVRGEGLTWSPVLVCSSGTMRGSRGARVRAPRLLDALQPVIPPSHLTPGPAEAPSPCSLPLPLFLAICFCLPHPPHPCPRPVLSSAALSSGRAWENSAGLVQG